MQTQVELLFPGYNSMVVANWLDSSCKLTQSFEWLLFLDSPPFLLALPKILEELSLQLLPLRLPLGGVIVMVERPEDVVQVFLPPCTFVMSEVPQGVFRGSPRNTAKLWRGVPWSGG